ncbi:MAG: GPR endopeptidase [Clostridia bacterium]|nr:GPR endopeptidase [Clostridia bacterium]
MLEKRTDLALEVHELHGNGSGISVSEKNVLGFFVTYADVKDAEGARLSGKPIGRYITFDVGELYKKGRDATVSAASVIAEEMKALFPKNCKSFLAVGLGNESITPDSVGPLAIKKLLVTRHIEFIDNALTTTSCSAVLPPYRPAFWVRPESKVWILYPRSFKKSSPNV